MKCPKNIKLEPLIYSLHVLAAETLILNEATEKIKIYAK